jgi:hypothetical protein
MRGLERERTMPKAFSRRVGAMDMLRMPLHAQRSPGCSARGVAAPKIGLAEDNPQCPSPRAIP